MIFQIDRLRSYINYACEPSPKAFPNECERKLQFRRNENFLYMHAIYLAILSFHTFFIKANPPLANYWYIGVYFIIITVFCFTIRSYPHLFRLFYAVVILGSGPTAVYLDTNSITVVWGSMFFNPTLLMFFSSSHILYLLQVGIQFLVIGAYYKEKMIDLMDISSSEDFVKKLLTSTIFGAVVNMISMYNIRTSLISSYRQELLLTDNKRKELEVQKTFILSFSHEIRNLINTLAGNIQLSLLEKVPPKVKNYLEEAEIGAGLLLQLINNTLDSGNLDVGELNINQSNQEIHGTLEKTWRMCAYLLKAKNLNGQFRIMKSIPQNLKLDHERFMQIFINLTVNAVKFTDKGSVDVKLEWIPNTVTVTEEQFLPSPFDDENEGIFEKDQALSVLGDAFTIVGLEKRKWSSHRYNSLPGTGPGLLKITVTDTGCGVPYDNLPFAFDRFSAQIFGDKDSKRLGTTIGLYVTKELCQRMGGDIKIFSKIDRGTSFIACIPAERLRPNSVIRRNSTLLPQPPRLRAMIVDDLHFNIVVLTSYLQRMNMEVINTAVDGLDAFTKYVDSIKKGTKPDVITMDVEMPVMDGKEAAIKIREYEKENKLEPCFLVMVSGNVCESEISQCLRYSRGVLANHFLKKPVVFDDFFRLLNDNFVIPNSNSVSYL